MRIPIQTAGRRNDNETRTPVWNRQYRFRPRPDSLPGAGRMAQRATRIHRRGQPVPGWPPRSGPPGPRVPPTPPNAPYFAAGFLNRSSASVGFSSSFVSFASITGLSSISVFSLCGYWTLPTGFQSP